MKKLVVLSLVAGIWGSLGAVGLRAAEVERIGKKIDNFTLKSHFGKEYSLADLADRDVVVVAFLGAECPLAKLYGPRLAELAGKLGDRVAFLGIDSNQQDSIQKIAAYAQRHAIEFPILKDPGNAVADQFAAQRTPEVFVLDKDRVIRYWGRIDDQYGFADGLGYQRPEPSRNDLLEAVNEVLAGKPVSVPTTDALGCLIGRVRPVNDNSPVTYSNQVARIFQNHCVECHRAGRIGPFEMTSYDEIVGWGEMIREVVEQGRMPPWHASAGHGKFANDLSLTDEDKQTIVAWVANGCPEGNPADLPPPRDFAEGWAIGEPDQVVYMRDRPVDVPAEGVIGYYHFVVDPGWTEDKWIMAAEAKPGSVETVHHILVFVQPPSPFARRFEANNANENGDAEGDAPRGGNRAQAGRQRGFRRGGGRGQGGANEEGQSGGGLTNGSLIAGYAPGMNPMFATDGSTAMHVKAGSKLIFQLHYTPNGTPQQDLSYCGFIFADPEQVKHAARSTAVVNAFFAIPPGADNHKAVASNTFENDALLTCLTPHMHTRGKSFRYEAFYPDGSNEILLDVPKYDFNWQTTYHLQEPKLIPKGTKLVCTAHWDNSEANLSNPDPTKTVTWGDQTFEEMMIGFYVEVYPKDQVPPEASGARAFSRLDPADIFQSLDANGDGKLTKDELPEHLSERMAFADLDGDGAISQKELETIIKLMLGRRGGGQ